MTDWEERMSSSRGIPYYYNKRTGESRWDPPAEDASKAQTGQVHAYHVLVKHAGSRRPASWRSPSITRSQDEAVELINEYMEQINHAEDRFAKLKELASMYSDCSSAKAGGDLGPFGRGQMQKPFEDAAFSLQPGELAYPVITDSGVHIIYRLQ